MDDFTEVLYTLITRFGPGSMLSIVGAAIAKYGAMYRNQQLTDLGNNLVRVAYREDDIYYTLTVEEKRGAKK